MKPWRTAGGERATHPANPPPRRSKEAPHRARAGEPELRTGPTAATEQTIPPVHSSPCLCGSVRAPKRSTHLTPPLHAQNKAARSALIRARARARKISGATLKSHYRKAARNNRPSSPFAASRLRVRSNTPQLPSAKQPRPSYSKNQRQQHVQIPTTDKAATNRVRVRVRETRTSTPTHASLSASISIANPAPAIIRANPCSSVAEKKSVAQKATR